VSAGLNADIKAEEIPAAADHFIPFTFLFLSLGLVVWPRLGMALESCYFLSCYHRGPV
jgi:hypothetical protein